MAILELDMLKICIEPQRYYFLDMVVIAVLFLSDKFLTAPLSLSSRPAVHVLPSAHAYTRAFDSHKRHVSFS